MLERIAQALRAYKENEDLVITPETTFKELALDSLDTVELVMEMEEEFSVSIELDENLQSVGDLIKTIESAQ